MRNGIKANKITRCVISASLSTMLMMSTAALPIQAKTYDTEIISLSQNAAKSTKKSKSSQVSWKNAGKALKCTVKTEEDFYKAMSNAIRLNAPTIKVTFDKSYKGRGLQVTKTEYGLLKEYDNRYAYDLGMSYNTVDWKIIQHNNDYSVATIRLSNPYWGAQLPYAYNTGDTSNLDSAYKTLYEVFSEAADGCTETTDLGKAEYAWNWVIDNMVYDMSSYGTDLPKSFSRPMSDGKYKGVCEDYANAYILLMRMLDMPCWLVRCDVVDDPTGSDWSGVTALHAIACVKINGEYRYFDPTFGKNNNIGKGTFNMTAKEAKKYYSPWVSEYEVARNAAKSTRKLSYSELEKYFIW